MPIGAPQVCTICHHNTTKKLTGSLGEECQPNSHHDRNFLRNFFCGHLLVHSLAGWLAYYTFSHKNQFNFAELNPRLLDFVLTIFLK